MKPKRETISITLAKQLIATLFPDDQKQAKKADKDWSRGYSCALIDAIDVISDFEERLINSQYVDEDRETR